MTFDFIYTIISTTERNYFRLLVVFQKKNQIKYESV